MVRALGDGVEAEDGLGNAKRGARRTKCRQALARAAPGGINGVDAGLLPHECRERQGDLPGRRFPIRVSPLHPVVTPQL